MKIYYSREDELYVAKFERLDIDASGKSIVEAAKNLVEVAVVCIEILEEDGQLEDYLEKHGCISAEPLDILFKGHSC